MEKKRSRQKVQKRIWGFWSKEKIRTKSGGPKKKFSTKSLQGKGENDGGGTTRRCQQITRQKEQQRQPAIFTNNNTNSSSIITHAIITTAAAM